MRNKKKFILKTIIITLLILIAYLAIAMKSPDLISLAKTYTAEEATKLSKETAISVKSWLAKQKESGYGILDQYSHGSLGSSPSITYDNLINDPNIYCAAKGMPLGYEGTWTHAGTYVATPAEAWVLAETANNVSGGSTGLSFTKTQTEYDGSKKKLEEFAKIGEETVYRVKSQKNVVDNTGDETYVIKASDGKYYVVVLNPSSGGGDGVYSYVQYAWWLVCTRTENVYTPTDLSGGLASEARDFESYVKEMNGGDTSWPKNEDGTFKINYNVGMSPEKSSDLKVTFDSDTNKYLVGPLKINYKRRTTQQGQRAKVDFAGITKMTLVGTDGNGNEVLDSAGESIFVQNKNFEIVYKDEAAHNKKAQEFMDTDETYAFPYDGEEFYLSIDYLDDVVALKSFKVDFHYMTAKGSYEVYTGTLTDEETGETTTLQKITNTTGPNEKIDVDAFSGLDGERAAMPVELEIMTEPRDLRTHLSGMVWIDQDEQKDQATGTLGIKDKSEAYAADNSVEIVVWKVKYQKNNNKLTEVEREKAIAWGSSGNVIDFINNKVYIKDGKYEIPEIQVPSEEGLDTSKYVISYDVEFVYDGQTYEATEYLKSSGKDKVDDKLAAFKKTVSETAGADSDYSKIKGTSAKVDYSNDSYVVENSAERKDFDSYFTEFYGDKSIDTSNGTTEGKATGGVGQSQYNKVENGSRENKEASLNYTSTDVGGEYTKKASTLVTHDDKGYIYDQYKFSARTSEAGLVFPYETKYHVERKNYDNITIMKNAYKPVDEYFNQINLGLLERYHTDVSVLKDLYKAKVVVNEQETDYTYNSLGLLTGEALDKTIQPEYRKQTYSIGLYNSDFKYRSSAYDLIEKDKITKTLVKALKEGTELRLFVTYKIQLYNTSEFTDVSINEFNDYYDKSFSMVGLETDGKKVTSYISTGDKKDVAREEKTVAETPYYRKLMASNSYSDLYSWNKEDDLKNKYIDGLGDNDKATGELTFEQLANNGDYKVAKCTGLSALSKDKKSVDDKLTLEPGESFEVYVTYEVDKEGYDKIQNPEQTKQTNRDDLLNEKSNIAEISRFTSVYTDEAIARHKTTRYKAGQISGRVDRDSAPDNINVAAKDANGKLDSKFFEDDTESAPVLKVTLKNEDNIRKLNGVVWEDGRDDNGEANGIYDTGETVIPNVDVQLVEKIKVDPQDLQPGGKLYDKKSTDNELADILVNINTLDYEFEYIWPDKSFDNETYTSKAVTNNNGEYEFKDFLSGNYVVRFEYGNNEGTLKYNGQDYKNTSYQVNMKNDSAKKNEKGEIYSGTVDGTVDGTASSESLSENSARTTLNNQWQDLSSGTQATALNTARVSDARDYEPRRLSVDAYSRTITNKNAEVLAGYVDDKDTNLTAEYKQLLNNNKAELMDKTAMVANTAKFVVDIENQKEINYQSNVKTTEGNKSATTDVHNYIIPNIDFGLTKRPETRLYIQKEINKIELLKNDGKDVVLTVTCDDEGNIIKSGNTSSDNATIRADKITEMKKELLSAGAQGFKYVAVEASYLKGLQVKLTYKINVINKSEVDYTTKKVAEIKDAQTLFNLATNYESGADLAEGELSPFNTGKGIQYGKYVGLHYYTNSTAATKNEDLTDRYKYAYKDENSDVVVKTTVDQLVDYVDNDISISKDDTENVANQSWSESSEADRKNKLSSVAYVGNTVADDKLQDNKERAYIATGKNNVVVSDNERMSVDERVITYYRAQTSNGQPLTDTVDGVIKPKVDSKSLKMYSTVDDSVVSETRSKYNTDITKELLPESVNADESKTTMMVVTTSQGSEDAIKNMNYDNLVEIVMYSNPVGRRDTEAIPGNANMIAKQRPAYEAGYDKVAKKDAQGNVTYEFQPKTTKLSETESVTTERDAYAAKDTITFSEPTGLSLQRQKTNVAIRVILGILIVAAVTIMIITIVMVVKKTKYDDDIASEK